MGLAIDLILTELEVNNITILDNLERGKENQD